MGRKSMYCVLEFVDTKELAIVPMCWLNEEKRKCRWPPFRSDSALTASIMKAMTPENNWTTYETRCLHVCDSYEEANGKLAAAEMISNLAVKLSDEGKSNKVKKAGMQVKSLDCSGDPENLSEPVPCQATSDTAASSISIPSTYLESVEVVKIDPTENRSILPDSHKGIKRKLSEISDDVRDLSTEEQQCNSKVEYILPDSYAIVNGCDDRSVFRLSNSNKSSTLVTRTVSPILTHAVSPSSQLLSIPTSILVAPQSSTSQYRRMYIVDSPDEAKTKHAVVGISDVALKNSGAQKTLKRKVDQVPSNSVTISSDSEERPVVSPPPNTFKSPIFGQKIVPSVSSTMVSSSSPHTSVPSSILLNSPPSDSSQTIEISFIDSSENIAIPSHVRVNNVSQQKQDETCSCCKLIRAEVQEMKLQLELHTQLLRSLLEGNNANTETAVKRTLPIEIKDLLPLSSVDDLKHFDDYLAEESNFSQCCAYFSSLGGNNRKDATRRILKQVISHEVSLQMNWKGRGYKQAFKNYQNVVNLIYRSVAEVPTCHMTTLYEIENEIKNWLRFAGDRCGGRSKRLSSHMHISCD